MDTTILLVRHGQTEWNRNERFRGRFDLSLNEKGLDQAERTADRISKAWKLAAVYSSPLSRAMKTAEIIAQPHSVEVLPDSGLIDIDYGEWQGLTPSEVGERWPRQYDCWMNNPAESKIPGGESLLEVRARAMDFFTETAKNHVNQTVLLVSHTVVIRLLLLSVLGIGVQAFWRLGQEPCALNVIRQKEQSYILASMNDTCHLGN
jgi:broad specificity phosphatase PhoE